MQTLQNAQNSLHALRIRVNMAIAEPGKIQLIAHAILDIPVQRVQLKISSKHSLPVEEYDDQRGRRFFLPLNNGIVISPVKMIAQIPTA